MSWWGTVYIASTVLLGAASAYSSYRQGIAARKYYNYLAEQEEEEAKHVQKIGDKQSVLIQDTAKLKGMRQKTQAIQAEAAQKAAMVANGMDLSSVSAQDIASDTITKAKLDEIAIRYNADVKTWQVNTDTAYKDWALRTKAVQDRYAGEAAYRKGRSAIGTTLLTTAVSVIGFGALKFGGETKDIGKEAVDTSGTTGLFSLYA